MQIDPREYLSLSLEAHVLLEDIPVHDVWAIALKRGPAERTVLDVVEIFGDSAQSLSSLPVKILFGLRSVVGGVLGWDGTRESAPAQGSRISRLSPDQRERSLAEPGTALGPFQLIYAFPHELVGEIRNGPRFRLPGSSAPGRQLPSLLGHLRGSSVGLDASLYEPDRPLSPLDCLSHDSQETPASVGSA